jgi:hypothetical protein
VQTNLHGAPADGLDTIEGLGEDDSRRQPYKSSSSRFHKWVFTAEAIPGLS